MRPGPFNIIEGLAGELPPEILLLAAMVESQITDLALLHRRGLWVDDPQEIGARLRGANLPTNDWISRVAMEEWLLWTRPTDALLRALERYTNIRLDRGRMVSLAKGYYQRHADDVRRREAKANARSLKSYRMRRRAGKGGGA